MKWNERIVIAWSLLAIAFSAGCIRHQQVDGPLDAAVHGLCIVLHIGFITAYVVMWQLRERKEHSPDEQPHQR